VKHVSPPILALALLAQVGLLCLPGCRRQERLPDLQKQIGRLQSESEDEIYTALKNLQTLTVRADTAVPDLRNLLKSTTNDDLRAEIAKTLGCIGAGAADAVPDLVAMLDRKAMWPRYCAAEALGKMGPVAKTALPKLGAMTRDKNPDVAAAATDAVRRLQRSAKKR